MAGPIDIIAIISPRAGKVDRAAELLTGMGEWVKKNEPKTLRYQLHRTINNKTGVEELIMLESYESMSAIQAHGSSPEFLAFQKKMAEEDLVAAPMQIKIMKAESGFASRL